MIREYNSRNFYFAAAILYKRRINLFILIYVCMCVCILVSVVSFLEMVREYFRLSDFSVYDLEFRIYVH